MDTLLQVVGGESECLQDLPVATGASHQREAVVCYVSEDVWHAHLLAVMVVTEHTILGKHCRARNSSDDDLDQNFVYLGARPGTAVTFCSRRSARPGRPLFHAALIAPLSRREFSAGLT